MMYFTFCSNYYVELLNEEKVESSTRVVRKSQLLRVRQAEEREEPTGSSSSGAAASGIFSHINTLVALPALILLLKACFALFIKL